MPLHVGTTGSTVFIRREAFESRALERSVFDSRYNLTDAEFRVEEGIIAIGPLVSDDDLSALLDDLEARGLTYFEDYFELSGNWPSWLELFVRSGGGSNS